MLLREEDPMESTDWSTIITSAAVASLVTTFTTAIGQYLERRARRAELLLKHAVEFAVARRELAIRIAEKAGVRAMLVEDVVVTERYFGWLRRLLEDGKLPPEVPRPNDSDHQIPGRM
jgi:hypothetical protein